MKKLFLFLLLTVMFLAPGAAHGLTPDTTYYVHVDAISSRGIVTSLGLSTKTVSDSGGKISFSFQSGIPDRTRYNFLLVTVKDATYNTVRRSIVPAAATGQTTNLGVSPMTEAQTEAMLSAMRTAQSDDPVMLLFGWVIIRSGGFTSEDIVHLANLGRLGIRSGFNVYLEEKIGAEKMNVFRSAIVDRLRDYTSLLKQSVEAADTAAAKDERARAAGLLSRILIEAAAEADFDVGYITAAMKAASDQVEDYLSSEGAGMNESAVSAMDSVMISNYMKLTAERLRKKYTLALSTLGAGQAQITRYNDAVTDMSDALAEAFELMEEVFENEETLAAKDEIDEKWDEAQTAINNAFGQFTADAAATNDEIDEMLDAMNTGFAINNLASLEAMRGGAAVNSQGKEYYNGVFTFRDMTGNINNWPITMVIPMIWVAENHGNDFSYTRQTDDEFPAPQAMEWLDSDNDPSNGIDNKRHDFKAAYGMPDGMAAIMGLREDIEIITARKWAGLAAASRDMTQAGYDNLPAIDKPTADQYIADGDLTIISAEDSASDDDLAGITLDSFEVIEDLAPYLTGVESQGIEDLFIQRLSARKPDIGPYTITGTQKQALIDTAIMPDFR